MIPFVGHEDQPSPSITNMEIDRRCEAEEKPQGLRDGEYRHSIVPEGEAHSSSRSDEHPRSQNMGAVPRSTAHLAPVGVERQNSIREDARRTGGTVSNQAPSLTSLSS